MFPPFDNLPMPKSNANGMTDAKTCNKLLSTRTKIHLTEISSKSGASHSFLKFDNKFIDLAKKLLSQSQSQTLWWPYDLTKVADDFSSQATLSIWLCIVMQGYSSFILVHFLQNLCFMSLLLIHDFLLKLMSCRPSLH